MHQLLAIVEVDKESRVKCGGPGCKSYVYKRIHIVETETGLTVLGSDCYKHSFSQGSSSSIYTGSNSLQLTEEQRALLIENTQLLISRLEKELLTKKKNEMPVVEVSTSITAHDNKPSLDRDTAVGPLRRVRCYYCKNMMETDLLHTPAMGFKCQSCKELRVKPPGRKHIRSRRF